MTWNFACSTTETSTWADGGRKFGELMEKATGGKVKVNVYATDQLTNGNQSEGIQALMNGDPVQISMYPFRLSMILMMMRMLNLTVQPVKN